jgi:NADH:ubiquinone oxidoreductase subunit 5 (subunit L)/multisubunit Na+/H+ antiporter MnhA subunit
VLTQQKKKGIDFFFPFLFHGKGFISLFLFFFFFLLFHGKKRTKKESMEKKKKRFFPFLLV